MTSPPTKQELISLVESMCEVQDRTRGARGMPEHIQRPHVDNMEALKAPVFILWEQLGYGKTRKNGVCCYTWGEKRTIGSKKRTMPLQS